MRRASLIEIILVKCIEDPRKLRIYKKYASQAEQHFAGIDPLGAESELTFIPEKIAEINVHAMAEHQFKEIHKEVAYPYHPVSDDTDIPPVDIRITVEDQEQHGYYFQHSQSIPSLLGKRTCEHGKDSENSTYSAHEHHYRELMLP